MASRRNGLRCCAVGLVLGAACLAVITGEAVARDDARLWQALRNGEAFAMMRHAIAPGTGDPRNFKLGDCATQRNLSDRGRAQARTAGSLFQSNGVTQASVYSSQWCRCQETARLLNIGSVNDLAPLNSFFRNYDRGAAQTRALRKWLDAYRGRTPLVLVTHQVNITALTGRGVRSGEIVVVKMKPNGRRNILGSIIPQ